MKGIETTMIMIMMAMKTLETTILPEIEVIDRIKGGVSRTGTMIEGVTPKMEVIETDLKTIEGVLKGNRVEEM